MDVTISLPEDISESLAGQWGNVPRQTELLHRFYGEVIVPEAVLRELTYPADSSRKRIDRRP
jgi:predicted nucleic acid-binding protein